MENRPGVGVGVIIQNKKGQILIGKRIGKHAPFYSIPGGHLELGETFEQAAIREVYEETGLSVFDPEVIGLSNNLKTYQLENKHNISVTLFTDQIQGVPLAKEPDKCEQWFWADPGKLPEPHFDASEMSVACFLQQKFYIPNS